MEFPKIFKTNKPLNDKEVFFAEKREAEDFCNSKMNENMEIALVKLMKLLDYENTQKYKYSNDALMKVVDDKGLGQAKELIEGKEEYIQMAMDNCDKLGITAHEMDLYRKHIWTTKKTEYKKE